MLKFRCLKKEDKETLHSVIGVQTKAEKCFLKRKLDFLTAHQHFVHGHEEFKTTHLTLKRLRYIYIYIYGAPILDVSRSHTTTQHSR